MKAVNVRKDVYMADGTGTVFSHAFPPTGLTSCGVEKVALHSFFGHSVVQQPVD